MSRIDQDLCWTSEERTRGCIRALVVSFHGLNNPGTFPNCNTFENEWADAGVLIAKPACGPWSFMNADTVPFIDDLIPELRQVYELSDQVPLFIHGGSMGGCAALTYTAIGAHTPIACMALEPVADLEQQAARSRKMERICQLAFGYERWREVIAERSPHRLLERYPAIPYLIAHGPKDPVIDGRHSVALADAMRSRGLDVAYHDYPDYGHQGGHPLDLVQRLVSFVVSRLPVAATAG